MTGSGYKKSSMIDFHWLPISSLLRPYLKPPVDPARVFKLA